MEGESTMTNSFISRHFCLMWRVFSSPCWRSPPSSPPSSWWRWSPSGWLGHSSWPGSCPAQQWGLLGKSQRHKHHHKLQMRDYSIIWILPLFIWDHSFTFNVILRKFSTEMFLISIFCFLFFPENIRNIILHIYTLKLVAFISCSIFFT